MPGTHRDHPRAGQDARNGDAADWQRLSAYLADIPANDMADVARAFNQFLNLANIAEQHHLTRPHRDRHGAAVAARRCTPGGDPGGPRHRAALTAHPISKCCGRRSRNTTPSPQALATRDQEGAGGDTERDLARSIAEACTQTNC
ncbi:MAG: phosphoenolpyruvate carboxylase [Gammaproteobacteria bacterium]|nr:phosphoenolpyruvate carboxylase [Gammaproteobacteria bacterium]